METGILIEHKARWSLMWPNKRRMQPLFQVSLFLIRKRKTRKYTNNICPSVTVFETFFYRIWKVFLQNSNRGTNIFSEYIISISHCFGVKKGLYWHFVSRVKYSKKHRETRCIWNEQKRSFQSVLLSLSWDTTSKTYAGVWTPI